MKSRTRRILAIMVGVCGVGTMTWLAIGGNQQAFTTLGIITSMVLAFYFGTKAT